MNGTNILEMLSTTRPAVIYHDKQNDSLSWELTTGFPVVATDRAPYQTAPGRAGQLIQLARHQAGRSR